MIKGSDKISEFPNQFNKLEEDVKSLSRNAKGIRNATWIAAISTLALAIIGILAFFVPFFEK